MNLRTVKIIRVITNKQKPFLKGLRQMKKYLVVQQVRYRRNENWPTEEITKVAA